MAKIGLMVGGVGLANDASIVDGKTTTEWGEASSPVMLHKSAGNEFFLLKRHGVQADINPHQINYRANVALLNDYGVNLVVATHTVGSIDPDLTVGQVVIPDQIIDYTWGRAQTFDDQRRHVEFSHPYDREFTSMLASLDPDFELGGTYGCTQGPRLETAAEIRRMANDGCTLVGMTAMPEASLARELGLPYISLCVVVNPAAGVADAARDHRYGGTECCLASRCGQRMEKSAI